MARLGPNLFRVECQNFKAVAAEQASDEWCWAACAQMIRRYNGERVSQAEIAQRIRGAEDRQTATLDEIMLAMNPDLIRDWSRLRRKRRITISPGFLLSAEIRKRTITTDAIVEELSDGWPLVVGMRENESTPMGHASVVYAGTYSRADTGLWPNLLGDKGKSITGRLIRQFHVQEVELFDPWPRSGSRVVTLSGGSAAFDFLISRREARKVLKEGLKSIQ